jgi:hypothetical protein
MSLEHRYRKLLHAYPAQREEEILGTYLAALSPAQARAILEKIRAQSA